MEAAACEIARLPEELLSAVISSTSPPDACRAAAVSPAFRAAADSDAVWSCFLPPELPPLADGALEPALPSMKAMFMRLSNGPILLADRLVWMWLDRESGAKCYMLPARALDMPWVKTHGWRWIRIDPINDSSLKDAAYLLESSWLEISGKIHSKMLTQNSAYAAYIVFKMTDKFYGSDIPVQEATVCIGESRLTRRVSIQGFGNDDEDKDDEDQSYRGSIREHHSPPPANVLLPQKRADGWMELEMGAFYNEQGDDGEVSISLTQSKVLASTNYIIVRGIEVRSK